MATSTAARNSSPRPSSENRSELKKLMTSLSTRFINLPVDAIDASLNEMLQRVGTFTGVDRCFVSQFVEEDNSVGRLTHEWSAPGVRPTKPQLQAVPLPPLAWAIDQLRAGKIVHVPRVADLPTAAAAFREFYDQLGIQSAVLLPLFFRSQIIGILGFSCQNREKTWSEESIELLRVVGEIFVNALDRKQADQQLRDSEERYRSVVEDQADFVVRWKPDGEHTFVNQAICRFFDKSRGELMASNVYDSIHQDDLPEMRRKLASLTPNQPAATDEHRVLLDDGRVAWHEWTDRALFDDAGRVVEYQSVGRDVTPQRRSRDELQYRLDFENLLLGLSTRFINVPTDQINEELVDALARVGEFTGVDRSYVYLVDPAMSTARMKYSWSAKGMPPMSAEIEQLELQDYPWAISLLERDEPVYIPRISALPAAAEKLRSALDKSGVQSYIHVPMLARGKLVGMVGFSSTLPEQLWPEESVALLRLVGKMFVNAIQRKQTAVALERSEERLRATVGALADGFHDWNVATGDIYFSDYSLEVLGLPAGKNWVRIEDWQERVHPDDLPKIDEALEAHFCGKAPVFSCDYRLRRPDGQYVWRRNRGRVIARDSEGAPLRLVGIGQDIDDEVLAEQRLRDTEAQLAHLARVITMGEIVAGIAHEVNQPLHAAATFAAAASAAIDSDDPTGPERARLMLGKISQQVTRAADIIRRLREFTRPCPVRLGMFDLNALVRESAELLAFEARRQSIRLEYDFDESLPPLRGDRVQLQQVFVNLLSNAFDATISAESKHSLVKVVTRLTNKGARIEVIDNGAGPPGDKEIGRLFDSFITTKSDGMGMGLALCRTIVTNHRGKIWGEANASGGMTFIFLLPLPESSPS